MRCEDLRERLDDLWEREQPAEVREHLRRCESCARYWRDLYQVRSGFRLLKAEEVPELSLGFAERVVRQLRELSRQPSVVDFFERVGRRFVYASLVATVLALLALALPSTGPVRGLTAADLQPAQEATVAYADPLGDSALGEPSEGVPGESLVPPVRNGEVK